MGIFGTIVSTAGAAASIITSPDYNIDWKEQAPRDAAIQHWPEVKKKADAALPLAGLRLTAEQKAKLDELLKGESVFPDEPTEVLLDGLPDAIPPASLNRIIGSVIDDCIKNHKHDFVPAIPSGKEEPIIQKHWCDDLSIKRASLVIAPAFTRYLRSEPSLEHAEPIWAAPQDRVCVHIQRNEVIYMGVVSTEVPPLEVIELLEGISQAITEYIGKVSELTIKENFTTIYQLLSEMVDSGSAVTTDTAVLRGLVPVPSLVNRVFENVSGIGIVPEKRPDVNTSSTPWRAQGIRHSNNEFFVDVVERIDAIVGADGSVVSYDVSGDIECKSWLSGMPDMLLSLNKPQAMDDVAFHPCVRLGKWEAEKKIAFIPPDGPFKLASFHASTDTLDKVLPLHVFATTSAKEMDHTIEFEVETGQCNGRPIENVSLRVPLPAQAYNIRVQCKVGAHTVSNARSPRVDWTIKSLKPADRVARLVIQYYVRPGAQAGSEKSSPVVRGSGASAAFIEFEVPGFSASSVKVDSLKVLRESYKIYKGVRYVTKAGSFQLRF
ncbi:hypothetical protein EV175_001923 [Coemansia sp. RSA 1933]|nr:hypothetical protein EV175_001923 [Coemansia sp. RSA 1933]